MNQRFILSMDPEKIVFPVMQLTHNMKNNIDNELIQFLKQYIFVSDFELLPQLINIDSPILSTNNESSILNVVYGFIVKHTNSVNNAFWLEFELLKEQPYSNILFEVMQKLR